MFHLSFRNKSESWKYSLQYPFQDFYYSKIILNFNIIPSLQYSNDIYTTMGMIDFPIDIRIFHMNIDLAGYSSVETSEIPNLASLLRKVTLVLVAQANWKGSPSVLVWRLIHSFKINSNQ